MTCRSDMYVKKKRQGWMIWHQDVDNLLKRVKSRDLMPMIVGLNELSKALANGEGEPSPPHFSNEIADATFGTMADKIRSDSETYSEKCKRNQNNVRQRSLTTVNGRSSLNQHNTTQHNSTQLNSEEVEEATSVTVVSSLTGEDITENIKRGQLVDELIRKYNCTDSDIMRDALVEDLEKYGEEDVCEALQYCAMHDTKGKTSVAYYRKLLSTNTGREADQDEWGGLRFD